MSIATDRIAAAWSKLRRSLAPRGLKESPQPAKPPIPESSATPPLHPFDRRYGVDTSGLIVGDDLRSCHAHDIFNTAYYGMAPSRLRWIMEHWISDETHPGLEAYAFVDLGCGKGRAIMLASEFPFRQAFGVELHPGLARIAQRNLVLWEAAKRNLCPVQVTCQDATEFLFPPGHCLLYLFHPFGAPVVERLIEGLASQFAGRPGALDVIYFNPEAGDLFESRAGFKLLWTGTVPMSEEDTAADSAASPQDLCSVFRWIGTEGGTH